jgi:hypothetical protein
MSYDPVQRQPHPDLSDNKIKRFSSHSGRVWATVLLDEARMTPDFIKSCLHWMGDLYRLYLCDTSIQQQQHVDAVNRESDKVMQLSGSNRNILPNIIEEDDEMGQY